MRRFALLVLLLAAWTSAHAASFDCKLAKSPREKAICADPKLSAADSALAAKYEKLRRTLSPKSFSAILADQREWLRLLGCSEKACLLQAYEERAEELHMAQVGPVALYTRVESDIRWPQADAATGPLTAWNTAIFQCLLKDVGQGDHPNAKTLRAALSEDDELSLHVEYEFEGLNQHHILTLFKYLHDGGAHPSADFTHFNYSLDLRRELRGTDVFANSSHWEDELTNSGLKQLKAAEVEIWDGKEGPEAVRHGVTDVRHWTLDSSGLTVTYGQYELYCYACGSGWEQIHFTWQKLKPLLNPAFHPDQLPPPSSKPQDN